MISRCSAVAARAAAASSDQTIVPVTGCNRRLHGHRRSPPSQLGDAASRTSAGAATTLSRLGCAWASQDASGLGEPGWVAHCQYEVDAGRLAHPVHDPVDPRELRELDLGVDPAAARCSEIAPGWAR